MGLGGVLCTSNYFDYLTAVHLLVWEMEEGKSERGRARGHGDGLDGAARGRSGFRAQGFSLVLLLLGCRSG